MHSVLKLLDELEARINQARRLPMTSKVVLEAEDLLECLDRVRGALPADLAEAEALNRERGEMLKKAEVQARDIMEQAKKQAETLIQEAEITRQAQAQAEQIVGRAQSVAQEIKTGAHGYADDILSQLEQNLEKITAAVRQGRKELKSTRARANSA
ncbi:MAG: ATPase [Clostridia bacterium]|nr:MAG: ATPase [Clostridia bacterium]